MIKIQTNCIDSLKSLTIFPFTSSHLFPSLDTSPTITIPKNCQIKSHSSLSKNLDGDRKKNDTKLFWFLYPRCIFFFSLILDDLFKLFFPLPGLAGLNNQFTCVFVCHISTVQCARYTDLHTSIWCHLFQFFSFFFFFVVVPFFSQFISLRNRLQIDQNQAIGKNIPKREKE